MRCSSGHKLRQQRRWGALSAPRGAGWCGRSTRRPTRPAAWFSTSSTTARPSASPRRRSRRGTPACIRTRRRDHARACRDRHPSIRRYGPRAAQRREFRRAHAARRRYASITFGAASYADQNAGSGKTVTATGIGLSVTSGGKPVFGYSLASTSPRAPSARSRSARSRSAPTTSRAAAAPRFRRAIPSPSPRDRLPPATSLPRRCRSRRAPARRAQPEATRSRPRRGIRPGSAANYSITLQDGVLTLGGQQSQSGAQASAQILAQDPVSAAITPPCPRRARPRRPPPRRHRAA